MSHPLPTKTRPLSNHPGALERALRFADKRATQYWEDHQVSQARFWDGIHRDICDLIKNPALWPGEIGAGVRACLGEVRSDEIAKDCADRLHAAEVAFYAGDAR